MLGNLGLSVDLRYAESGYRGYDLGLLWGNSIGVYGSGFRVPEALNPKL